METEKPARVSSAMPKWLQAGGRKAKRMAGLKDGGVFEQVKYWRWIEPFGQPYYTAASRVKELLPIKGRRFVAVICYNGEIVVLENNADAPPRVEWVGRVAPQLPADETRPTKLRHAAYDSLHGAIFFTVDFSAVYYAILTEMEIQARANKVTRLTPFIQRSPVNQNEQFHGLAVDSENSVLFVCNNDCVTAWSTSKLDQPKKLQEIRFSTPISPTIQPYKVAIYLDIRGSSKMLLAITEKRKSTLTQLQLKYSRNSLGLGTTNAVQFQVISTISAPGSKLGSLSKPQGIHFDPAGNLLVADNNNQRIQIFPFALDGSTALDSADHELAVHTGLLSKLKSVVVVTAANDRPIVLAGMCGPFGNVGARNILRLTYGNDD